MDLKYICTHIKSFGSIATVNTTINSNPKSQLPVLYAYAGQVRLRLWKGRHFMDVNNEPRLKPRFL